MMLWVLTFQAYRHTPGGRRMKEDSPMTVVFEREGEMKDRVALLRSHANPSEQDIRNGAYPVSYDYSVYRIDRFGEGEFAILAGTTEFWVPGWDEVMTERRERRLERKAAG